ncbi:peptidase M23B [Caballeronia arvi]|uniref:Peptidase M23B n=1 Tax=Caballeronia arvi TaxID=1777135 RepID=A0A158FAL2_9BURK|nr:M23 family metallopeptidase [Caballeronia arvi]SAL16369.1 peptidase M23B [Caballeronia arvi]
MGSGISCKRNDPYIVMRRGALRSIVSTACSAVLLALAAGVAVGHAGVAVGHKSTPAPLVHREPARAPTTSPLTASELARLHAANASLDARIERLAAQVDTLSAFDQRLRARATRASATGKVASARASGDDAAGGPELPPRPCQASSAYSNPQIPRAELDCLSTTLSALEQDVAQREAALDAFPGRRPVAFGRTSSLFGNRLDPFTHHLSFHPGLDLSAPTGTPILAAAGGRVIRAGPMPGYGNAVEIDHGHGVITRYAHASKIEVRVGQTVKPGESIAEVGSTGRSTGPHLHFEVRVNDRPVNPADYLALFAGASAA